MRTLIASALLLCASACAAVNSDAPPTTTAETGQLNLTYAIASQGEASDKVLGIVSETGEIAGSLGEEDGGRQSHEADVAIHYRSSVGAERWSAPDSFRVQYLGDLRSAMGNSFTALLSARGFRTKGPYREIGEMTFPERKDVYLVAVAKLSLDLEQKQTQKRCSSVMCEETGVIQLGGELTIQLIEPLSEQTILNKRVSLTDFNISTSYLRETEYKQPQPQNASLVEQAISSVGKKEQRPSELRDTTDKALVDAVNAFFLKAMQEIDRALSREEILRYEADIAELKERKRY